MLMRFAAACFLFALSTPAYSATIEVMPPNRGDAPVLVTVIGAFEMSDIDDFRTKTSLLSRAVVAFASDGGSVVAGIDIGTIIRLKGFDSLVLDGMRCASACALAWLGGKSRYMGKSAQIGFHAAYTIDKGQPLGTSVGNAVVGAYLDKIGLSYQAIVYITRAAPEAMTWLSYADAAKQGIDVVPFAVESSAQTPASLQASPNPGGAEAPQAGGAPLNLHPAPPTTAVGGTPPSADTSPPQATINLLDLTGAARVQWRLQFLGYFDGIADGVWGPKSRAALRDFRRTQRLGGNDRWDAATEAALMSDGALPARSAVMADLDASESPVAPPVGATRNPLNRADALWAQSVLRELGYYYLTNGEGIWGLDSRRALRDFKTMNGLTQDDSWDGPTERRLSGVGQMRADQTFIGGWALTPSACGDGAHPPVMISSRHAEASGDVCEFDDIEREGVGWRARGNCIRGGKQAAANIVFTTNGSMLIASSERGTATYYRCRLMPPPAE